MKVLLIGATGQLGTDLMSVLAPLVELHSVGHADLEITDPVSVEQVLVEHAPDLVINTAAYNRVDDCEDQPDLALRINAVGPQILARACQQRGAALLHTSTDYVFSGESNSPWDEYDCPRPVSMYGISKLAGELAVQAACPRSYIVRVSGLFGLRGSRAKGGNFVETMLRLQRERRPIRVVDDQILAPTYTLDLARKMAEFIQVGAPFGVYHMTAAGSCSWYEFARTIFQLAGLEADLSPQATGDGNWQARRPRYSVLANREVRAIGLSLIRPWKDGLKHYLAQRLGSDYMAPAMEGATACAWS